MTGNVPSSDAAHSVDDGSDDPRVVAAVKEYMQLLEHGRPSRQEFLARHAEIAGPLADCLDGLEMLHEAAATPRSGRPSLLSPRLPEALGDFRILREIGRGGMGVVYEALHVPLARRVALKILPSSDSFDPLRLQRFKTEAQAAARLHHPNIVQVYSVGCENNINYYAMQLIDGSPLSTVITRLRRMAGKTSDQEAAGENTTWSITSPVVPAAPTRGVDQQSTNRVTSRQMHAGLTLPAVDDRLDNLSLVHNFAQPSAYIREAARLIQLAAIALEHAHQSAVIHRDVKPGNLLVTEDGQLWVADFGLARIETDVQLTRTGTPLGTARYMSPEQASGNLGLIDHRADVYSLGATLYELLTLEPAIAGDDSPTLLRRVVEDEPRPPRSINPQIPRDLETIVLKSIAKERDERYRSAQEMADDLGRWLEDKPIVAKPPTRWDRMAKWARRHRALVRSAAAMATLAVFALLLVTLTISRAYRSEAVQRQAAVASFEQARQAVDAFAEFGETELAAKPELRDVRRRLLETALRYYREFQLDHADDPQALAEMAATSERISRLVNELVVLEDAAPLFLLIDSRVQDELEMTPQQRQQTAAVFADLNIQRDSPEFWQNSNTASSIQRTAELLQANSNRLLGLLQPFQATRLQQIARQLRTPFVFRTTEVIEALALTSQQRQQINTIIEEERFVGRGRGRGGRGDFGESGFGGPGGGQREEPREFDDRGNRFRPEGTFTDGDFEPSEFRGRRGERRRDFGGRRGGPDGGPPGMRDTRGRTVARILEILTPEQRTTWNELVGRPFEHELRWGPDDILPR